MAKMYKSLFYLLFACLVLVSCTGEDGEPGPAGEQGEKGDQGEKGNAGEDGLDAVTKIGSLEGKIVGTRKDGTAFEYPFTYEYTYSNGGAFRDVQGKTAISIDRFTLTPFQNYASFDLEKVNGTLVPLNSTYSASFDFRKELNATTIFSLDADASFVDFAGEFRPISRAHNARYQFYYYGSNIWSTVYNGQNAYHVSGYNMAIYYRQSTGTLLGIDDYSTDQDITSGPVFNKYNELKLIFDANLGEYKFINATTQATLHEVIPAVPADKLTITNYSHNATTGILSFDFKLEISKYDVAGRVNTTEHDLVIEGKYNSGTKVYENTVGRTK